jgi:adenylate cyclase
MPDSLPVKIIIAEDEKIIALDLVNTLERLGYSVPGVGKSADDIFELIEEFDPHLVMMDIMLDGELSGIEATKIISEKYDLPVIFLTALTDEETLEKAKTTDAYGYLLKPFDEKTLHSTIEMAIYKFQVEHELKIKTKELEEEKKRTDSLLKNILPQEIVDEIKLNGNVKPRYYQQVSILFTEFHGFDLISSQINPNDLIYELNEVFENFDEIVQRHNLEKLKTIGDAYMIASGLPLEIINHAEKIVMAALEMQKFIDERNKTKKLKWEMKTGIHSGPVVAGIVGMRKFTYDIWGDSVNIASRMASSCLPEKINISGETYELVKEKFNCSYRGRLKVKGKGEIDMYFVEGLNLSTN